MLNLYFVFCPLRDSAVNTFDNFCADVENSGDEQKSRRVA
jgi:hypothetical protein